MIILHFLVLVLLVSLPLGLSLSLSLVLSGFLFSLLPPPPLILVLCHHSLSKVLKGMQDHLDLPPDRPTAEDQVCPRIPKRNHMELMRG